MNILHIAPYYPSLKAIHAGGVCMGHEYEELRNKNNVVSLSFIQEQYDADLYNIERKNNFFAIELKKWNKIINIILHPYIAPFFASRTSLRFLKCIYKCIEEYDIDAIHAEYTSMAQYVKIKKKYPNLKFNVVLHDVTAQSYERKILAENNLIKRSLLKYLLAIIKRNEKKWLANADKILTFSEKDKELVKKIYKLQNVERINTDFGLEEKRININKYKRKNDNLFGIGFIGQMGRKENSDAAKRLITICRKYISEDNIVIYIVGNGPSEELLNMANEKVVITGYVANVDKFLIENCDIAVFPLNMGAGIKVKVLHCMALGIPVITNKIGAEGIDENGKYISLVDTDEEFANSILTFCNHIDKKNCEEMIYYVMDKFSWNLTKQVFDEIYL